MLPGERARLHPAADTAQEAAAAALAHSLGAAGPGST
jgi:hypothetical protein